MSQHRQQFHMGGGGGGGGGHNAGGHFGDTTFTKIFVGGLAWETQRETMRRYFEQFGEIQEAVVITDKNTGRSKGYGFVTFKDPESATRACHDPSPVIDGRRANCNLASLGAQRSTRPTTPHQHGRYRAVSGGPPVLPPAAYHHHHQGQGGSSSAYFHQPAQYALPYSTYGYSGYSQENMYPMSYYSVYGGQHYSPYYATPPPAPATAAAAAPSTPHSGGGIYPNFIPYYPQYAQPSQTQGFGIQYPQLIQYPYLPHHYTTAATAVLSLPASVPTVVPSATSSTNGTGTSQTAVATKTTTEQTSSST